MKSGLFILLIFCLQILGSDAFALDSSTSDLKCPGDVGPILETNGICADPSKPDSPSLIQGSFPLLFPLQNTQKRQIEQEADQHSTPDSINRSTDVPAKIIVYFFWGKGCPHCKEELQFLQELKRAQSSLDIRMYEVWYNKDNARLMATMLGSYGVHSSGVPVTVVHDQVFSGFTAQSKSALKKAIDACGTAPCGDPAERLRKTVTVESPVQQPLPFVSRSTATANVASAETSVSIPFLGSLDTRNASLPMLTLIIAGMDSFNPCAFFVLLSLLGLLVHARSRNKMLLIGGIFVFFSGFIYFLFMAAWLNLFLVMGHVEVITIIAGCISVLIAGINIKDFFMFKQGISLTIPESAKPKLFDRMRKLLRSNSLVSLMIGTTVLAIAANSYELLCTAGFPMVFTRILTLSNLSTATYYLYLVLYNMVYVVPLFIIVLGFTYTLGKRQLSEWQGRVLKLVSGCMMLGLGGILLINPTLLNSVLISVLILASALFVSMIVVMVMGRCGKK